MKITKTITEIVIGEGYKQFLDTEWDFEEFYMSGEMANILWYRAKHKKVIGCVVDINSKWVSGVSYKDFKEESKVLQL